jgi:hypothetical protein
MLALAVLAGVVCLRAAAYGDVVLAVIANAAGALVLALYMPALMTAVYNLAKTSPCALRFHIVTEGGWDAGAASGCLVAAGLLWAGAPFSAGVLTALAGAASVALLLRRYYARLAWATA